MSINQKSNEKPQYIRRLMQNPPDIMEGFHHEDLLDFLGMGIEETFSKNDVIIEKSDYVNSGYLVCEGKVSVWDDNIELTSLSENSFLGETFLFGDRNRMAKIVSADESLLLRFQRQDMLHFFKRKPSKLFNIFTRNIIYVQQQKMEEMNHMLLNVKKQLVKLQ